MFRSKKLAVAVGGAVAALAVGSFALAAIPDGGIIHGCYKKDTGALRIYDNATNLPKACTDKEAALDWNQQGGASNAYSRVAAYTQVPGSSTWTTVASRAVPAGKYVLSAKVYVRPGGLNTPSSIVGCALRVADGAGGLSDYSYATVSSDGSGDVLVATIALANNNTTVLANGGAVSVECESPQPIEARQVKLTALQVASLDYQ
jgi:hypothetical protein